MFIDANGKKCRNIQEQVEWNLEEIVKIKGQLDSLGQLYIEIDDSSSVGSGTLSSDDLKKLKNYDYVAVLMKRASDVYLKFNAGAYIEQDILIKSMSAGGYFRKLQIDLDTGAWTLTESNEDISALADEVEELAQDVEDLETTVDGKSTVSADAQPHAGASEIKSITIDGTEYNLPDGGGSADIPTIEISLVAPSTSGTITSAQYDTINQANSKIKLNYMTSVAFTADKFEFYRQDKNQVDGDQPLYFTCQKGSFRYTLVVSNAYTYNITVEEIKPVSGTHEDGKWKTITIGNETKDIPSGGSSGQADEKTILTKDGKYETAAGGWDEQTTTSLPICNSSITQHATDPTIFKINNVDNPINVGDLVNGSIVDGSVVISFNNAEVKYQSIKVGGITSSYLAAANSDGTCFMFYYMFDGVNESLCIINQTLETITAAGTNVKATKDVISHNYHEINPNYIPVKANPTETATGGNLTKLRVGSTIYDVPQASEPEIEVIERECIIDATMLPSYRWIGSLPAGTIAKMKQGKVSLTLKLVQIAGGTPDYIGVVSDYYFINGWNGIGANLIVNKGVATDSESVMKITFTYNTTTTPATEVITIDATPMYQERIQSIELEGTSGTITPAELTALLSGDLTYIKVKSGTDPDFVYEEYHKMDDKVADGYISFIHLEKESTYYKLKIITITTTTRGWTLDSTKLGGIASIQDTAPASAITDGGVHIVHLTSSSGITEYNGYIYMYDED